jgi:hypothetical protein
MGVSGIVVFGLVGMGEGVKMVNVGRVGYFVALVALAFLWIKPLAAADVRGLDISLPTSLSSKESGKSKSDSRKAESSLAKVDEVKPVGLARGARQMEVATSLAQLGYRNGIQFDGVQSVHDVEVFFPVPKDVNIQSGRVRLHYRSSALLHKQSNVRVYVNRIPLVASNLNSDGDQVLEIPVRKQDLMTKDGLIRLGVKVSMLFSDDRCLDERINGGYFYLQPESSLSITVRDEASSLRGAWDLLPREVKVSLPMGTVTPEIFSAAWSLNEMLVGEGKKVSFVRIPEIGDIVIAPDAQIQAALGQSVAGSNVALANAGEGRNVIVLSAPFDVTPFYLLSAKWRVLSSSSHYQVFPLEKAKAESEDKYRLMLNDMGLNTDTRQVDRIVEWHFMYSSDKMPSGYAAQSVELDVTSTPGSAEHPVMFYVYYNDVLQSASRLENDGKPHRISVAIPKEGATRRNAIRLVTQREYIEGDCHGDMPRFPVQIMPTSHMLVARHSIPTPKEFYELGMYFRDGFDTYLPVSYLQQPDRVLNMLTRLVIDQSMTVDTKRVSFYESNATLKPTNPFLVLGRPQIELDYQPVRFDKGHIKLLGENETTLLDVDRLPDLAIAQIVKADDAIGLWLAPGQEGAALPDNTFQFDHDDVAFVDSTGVLLNLDSRNPGSTRVYYPEQRTLMQWIDAHRYWLLFAAWAVLVAGVIFLFRRTRQTAASETE